jgi:triacylglycerol lipase
LARLIRITPPRGVEARRPARSGSEAADWSAALAPSYAPALNIVGTAAGGNLPDYDYNESQLDGTIWYGIQIGTMESFSRAYSDFKLSELLNPAGLALAAQAGSDTAGCGSSALNEPGANASEFTNFPSSQALAADPLVKRVLARMSLRYAPDPTTPEFIYNSVDDDIAFVQPVDAWVAQSCAAGVRVDYDRDALGGDHVIAVPHWWAGALPYLAARYAGDEAPDNCASWSSALPTP